MSTTALALEILLNEPTIDLSAAAELVLSDVGATIQIMRLACADYSAAADRPARVAECLSSLDASDWLRVVTRRTFACDRAHLAIASLWKRCRMVAQYARLAAESVDSISSDAAYLVGLLHDVPAISKVLFDGDDAEIEQSAAEAAIWGVMPLYMKDALDSARDIHSSSPWGFILNVACELADTSESFEVILPTEGANNYFRHR